MNMNYFLIKLAFDTAVHFGPSDTAQSLAVSEDHVCADTVFSALCHTALQTGGTELLEKLCSWAKKGEFLLSDTMPWREDDYYLPKPFALSESRNELSTAQRKTMKKLAWLPVGSFSSFCESIHGGRPFDPSQCQGSFGFQTETVKAAVSENEDAQPYQVGLYQFYEGCGLYIIAGIKTTEQETVLLSLFRVLGMGGIGGKSSSGYGKFHLEDEVLLNDFYDDQTQWLYQALIKESKRSLLLSSSYPKEEELDAALNGSAYQLVRRGGFIASDTYAKSPMKKKTQYFFRAGSTFSYRFAGDIYSVGKYGFHNVYRYGKPLFLGVDL